MTQPTIKIGLIGGLRAGKDTVAGHLTLMHDFQPFAFGDALKDVAHRAFPWIPREPKPRALYQHVGQSLRNMPIDGAENVWIEHTMRAVDDYLARVGGCNCDRMTVLKPRVVVSDVRQPNEVARLKAEGFVLIRVTAPVDVRLARARRAGDEFEAEALEHETERAVDGFDVDYEIANDGSMVDLLVQVDEVVGEIISGEESR